MKHLHMLIAVIVILLFLYQSYMVLTNKVVTKKAIKIATHINYALIIITGAWMLMQLVNVNAPVQWVYAKVILLIAAISACVKAFGSAAAPAQRKAGIIVAGVAYTGIVILAFAQPTNII